MAPLERLESRCLVAAVPDASNRRLVLNGQSRTLLEQVLPTLQLTHDGSHREVSGQRHGDLHASLRVVAAIAGSEKAP